MASFVVQGPAGQLDARMHGEPTRPVVLLLHPHPQFGGSMGSRLVYDLAVGLAAAGWCAVRFDFRGVGRSEGAYGQGAGEADDALAVMEHLTGRGQPVAALVGYSFGGAVACRVAAQRPVPRLVLVGTPVRLEGSVLDPLRDAAGVHARTALVVGSHDALVPAADAARLAAAFAPPAERVTIAEAGHFLEPSRNAACVAAVARILGPPGP